MLSDKKLEEIKRSHEKTTSDWQLNVSRKLTSGTLEYRVLGTYEHTCRQVSPPRICFACYPTARTTVFEEGENDRAEENAEFAVIAHESVPELVNEVKRLRGSLSRIAKMNEENEMLQRHWTLQDAADVASQCIEEEPAASISDDRFSFLG